MAENINKQVRVLVVEDSEFDALLMVKVLQGGGYQVTTERVDTEAGLRAALAAATWDVILADYNLPNFSAPAALRIVQELRLDVPFIIISGGIGEDIAVECMKAGAHDYLMKGSLARLVPAVERELREAAMRAARREAEQAMRESELRYRLLWESCPDAVILMDTNGFIQFANPAAEAVFGYKPAELLGRNISKLQPARLQSAHLAGIADYLRTGVRRASWAARESLGLHKDGREIIIEISGSDMVLQGQRRFVGFIRDITDRKKAEEALRSSLEQMKVAREIQQALFPKRAPELPGFEIAGASFPAEATGGDYFDFVPMLKGRLGIVVADVTGHGFGPAMLMAETRAYLRICANNREDVGEILTLANRTLAEDVGDERFVTLMLARLDPQTRALAYGNAGHPAGFILDAAGQLKTCLRPTGPPLGILAHKTFSSAPEISLQSGELLVLVTDGVEEAANPEGRLFGCAQVADFIAAHRHESAARLVELLYQQVRDFSQGAIQQDDVTVVVVKVN